MPKVGNFRAAQRRTDTDFDKSHKHPHLVFHPFMDPNGQDGNRKSSITT